MNHRRLSVISVLAATLLLVPAQASADCSYGPAWPGLTEVRGTTFVGVFKGATKVEGDAFRRFDWVVERVYAGHITTGRLEGWGYGRPSCHPLVLRAGTRYLISSDSPTGADAFATVAYEVLGGRVRLASFGAQQPRSTAPAVYQVDTLTEALAVLVPSLPPTDSVPMGSGPSVAPLGILFLATFIGVFLRRRDVAASAARI